MDLPDYYSTRALLIAVVGNIVKSTDSNKTEGVEIFPLSTNPKSQILPSIHKNHVYGLLYRLKLIKFKGININICDVNALNSYISESDYRFTSKKIPGVGKITWIDTSIHIKRNDDILDLSAEDIQNLKILRDDFLKMKQESKSKVTKTFPTINPKRKLLAINNTVEGIENTAPTNSTMEGIGNTAIEPLQIPVGRIPLAENTGFKNVLHGRKRQPVNIPKKTVLQSTYMAKKASEQVATLQREKLEMNQSISTLQEENVKLKVQVDRCQLDIAEMSRKNEEQNEKITKLERKIEQDKVKVEIGEKILRLPQSFKRWPGSRSAKRFYGLAFAQIPAASAKYLQMFIPLVICAFFFDIGIAQYFDSLEFIADITPSDKKLDECVLLLAEFVFFKIGGYFNKGAVCSCGHDKGDRNGLGRLIRVLALFNKLFKYDVNFHDGIISLRLDADGVDSTDDSIIEHLALSFDKIVPYLDEGKTVQLSSFTTDAGGGGGTKESCANKFETAYGEMMFMIWYVITCMLHAHSKPLELAWIAAFGEFGNGNNTMSQFVYGCWYIQNKQKTKVFKETWKRNTGEGWDGNILVQPILSRWGYPLKTVSTIYDKFEPWSTFVGQMYESSNSASSVFKTAKDALEIVKNPETKVQMSFLKAFGIYYWTPGYNWIRRKDKLTKLDGHSSHEALLAVFEMSTKLAKMESDGWKTIPEFKECLDLTEALPDIVAKGQKLSPRASTYSRFRIFVEQYRKTFETMTGFARWKSSLFPFSLASSNLPAAHIVANKILRKVEPSSEHTQLPNYGSSRKGVIGAFKYSDFEAFVETCEIPTDDKIITQNIAAIREMASGTPLFNPNPSDAMKKMQSNVEDIVYTAKHHGQQIEAGVRAISHCSQNQNSETVSSSFVVVQSYDNQIVTMQQAEDLRTREVRANQHMTGGSNKDQCRISKSEDSKRKTIERTENEQEFGSRPQASGVRAKLLIRHASNDPYPVKDEIYNLMWNQALKKSDRSNESAASLRDKQKLSSIEVQKNINEERKSGIRKRGKAKDASKVEATELVKPIIESGLMQIQNYSRKCQNLFIIEEILFRQYPDNKDERSRYRIALRKMKKVNQLKPLLKKQLEDKATEFETISPLCKRLGGAHSLIPLKDDVLRERREELDLDNPE